VWLLAGAACQDENGKDCVPAPFNCDGGQPTHALLNIHVSASPVPTVSIYSGSAYETGTLVWSGKPAAGVTDFSRLLPLGSYSVTARYTLHGDTVALAVDGDELGFSEEETCSGTCYSEEDGEVDLSLDKTLFAKARGK